MRKFLVLCCVASVLCIAGCRPKEKEKSNPSRSTRKVKKAEINDRQVLASINEDQQDLFLDNQDLRNEDPTVMASDINDIPSDLEEELSLAEAKMSEENDLESRFDFETVNFDLNNDKIRDDQREVVARNTEIALDAVDKGKDVFLIGHSCPMGTEKYNQSLSTRRADTIRKEMIASGIDSDRLKVLGCGSENPLVLTDAKDRTTQRREYAPNRRVEVIVQ